LGMIKQGYQTRREWVERGRATEGKRRRVYKLQAKGYVGEVVVEQKTKEAKVKRRYGRRREPARVSGKVRPQGRTNWVDATVVQTRNPGLGHYMRWTAEGRRYDEEARNRGRGGRAWRYVR
jgi:ribosomal protein S8